MGTTRLTSNSPDNSFSFVNEDILDLPALVAKLRDAHDPLSVHLRGMFADETQRLLDEFDASTPDDPDLVDALVVDLNRIVRAAPLFDEGRFAHVAVTNEARKLARQRPQETDHSRLNVMLLENAFPKELLQNIGSEPKIHVERVQTGVRIEKRMLKVLKALAEVSDLSLGALLEVIVLHAFAGVSTYDHPKWQERIAALKDVYGMDYDTHGAQRFSEADAA